METKNIKNSFQDNKDIYGHKWHSLPKWKLLNKKERPFS